MNESKTNLQTHLDFLCRMKRRAFQRRPTNAKFEILDFLGQHLDISSYQNVQQPSEYSLNICDVASVRRHYTPEGKCVERRRKNEPSEVEAELRKYWEELKSAENYSLCIEKVSDSENGGSLVLQSVSTACPERTEEVSANHVGSAISNRDEEETENSEIRSHGESGKAVENSFTYETSMIADIQKSMAKMFQPMTSTPINKFSNELGNMDPAAVFMGNLFSNNLENGDSAAVFAENHYSHGTAKSGRDLDSKELRSLSEASGAISLRNSCVGASLYWNLHSRTSIYAASSVAHESSRSLSMYDDKNEVPFYLVNPSRPFPWSKAYSNGRNYFNELLFICDQMALYTWNPGKMILNVVGAVKLGEGCFGEVFLVKIFGREAALKVIPIAGEVLVNGEEQKTFRDVLPEIIMARELSNLRQIENFTSTKGFIRMIGSFVVQGQYPRPLLKAWKKYDKTFQSQNDCPDIYGKNQHFVLLAFENGGSDLENYKVQNVQQAYSIVYQTICALIAAEIRLRFEHRDLHCGNLLIRCTDSNDSRVDYFHGSKVMIKMHGAEALIIDFTLSRMSKGNTTIFLNLENDAGLFESSGDLQFDIYRLMRKANKNNWIRFTAQTNVMWVFYLVCYMYRSLFEYNIGTDVERCAFANHFKSLHHEINLFDWLIGSCSEDSEIIKIEAIDF